MVYIFSHQVYYVCIFQTDILSGFIIKLIPGLGFSREKDSIGVLCTCLCVYICTYILNISIYLLSPNSGGRGGRQIYCEKLAHMNVQAEKFHDLSSASRRPREGGYFIVQV